MTCGPFIRTVDNNPNDVTYESTTPKFQFFPNVDTFYPVRVSNEDEILGNMSDVRSRLVSIHMFWTCVISKTLATIKSKHRRNHQ